MALMNRLTERLFTDARRTPPIDPRAADELYFDVPVQDWVSKAEKAVKGNPGISLLAAAGVGILLGWLVKRT